MSSVTMNVSSAHSGTDVLAELRESFKQTLTGLGKIARVPVALSKSSISSSRWRRRAQRKMLGEVGQQPSWFTTAAPKSEKAVSFAHEHKSSQHKATAEKMGLGSNATVNQVIEAMRQKTKQLRNPAQAATPQQAAMPKPRLSPQQTVSRWATPSTVLHLKDGMPVRQPTQQPGLVMQANATPVLDNALRNTGVERPMTQGMVIDPSVVASELNVPSWQKRQKSQAGGSRRRARRSRMSLGF